MDIRWDLYLICTIPHTIKNPENVKIRPKIGRIMWNLPLKIAQIMWKAPLKLWEFAICKSRIQQITKQIIYRILLIFQIIW
jgi:hypothetical protein